VIQSSPLLSCTHLLDIPSKRTPIYRRGLVIPYGGGGWKDSQVQEPLVMPDLADNSKLVMYFAGMAAPVAFGKQTIGRASASVANPLAWTEYVGNPIISDVSRRLDSIARVGGVSYLYSSNCSNPLTNTVDLFTSNDGEVTWTAYAGNPILTPTGQGRNDGDFVSQAAVTYDSGSWIMIYAYRNGATVLPGYRLATSPVGIVWTKAGAGDLLSISTAGSGLPDTKFMETHGMVKIGSVWTMIYDAYNGTDYTNGVWSLNLGFSSSLTTGWAKSPINPFFQRSNVLGSFDCLNIATPNLVLIGDSWWIFYQGSSNSGDYNLGHWSLGAAQLAGSPLDVR
jgi:hypothetical protein